ncbi:hypothetical protein CPJCM30710_13620 [Clostridium polyendosporum]|uniref:Purine-nucleoside phosphorylase n=1 Tax=Clostridium polyendosporum TaxID=69208 RepID=A0A919VGJ4_9CLOT|nr:DUF523 domain-containing protein [Clostridium polyendosporum]GIM28696.1 hypothetical protein CPJCM30710_13620 [Clostridium polyendosporum]
MIIISACLCGINCKYNGGNNLRKDIKDLFDQGKAVLVCPENLGELPTPRSAREIVGGTGKDVLEGRARVISAEGKDSTKEFLEGAEKTLEIAKKVGAKVAILKAKSPSCGCGWIYDGTFSGKLIKGNGVTAELLSKKGIKVYNEDNFKEEEWGEL